MKRSRLKNIINKSKTISNKQEVGNPFDEFKKSLPIEIDDNYRLEAAWKAYGSPKDYKTALWEGMIQPIDENNYKLPSIGYNEETDEYEYLNKGEDNETVAKDIRVWDNDIIPLVKELKLGGYVRTFNEEKDCWTYTKNSLKKEESIANNELQINSFKKGGKEKGLYSEWIKTVNPDYLMDDNYDYEKAYKELPIEELEEWRLDGLKPDKERKGIHLSGDYKKPNHPTYNDGQDPEFKGKYGWFYSDSSEWIFFPSPRLLRIHDYDWYIDYWNKYEPESTLGIGSYDNPIQFYSRIPAEERIKRFQDRISKLLLGAELTNSTYVSPPFLAFKLGGQMNVIPEVFKLGGAVIPSGSLHAHKNHMQLASEGLITPKGIPVVSEENGEIQLLAEIEREEVIFDKQATIDIEKLYKKFNETDKESEKNEIAIKAGKILTDIFINNTQDNTGLILKVAEKNNLEYNK